MPIDVQRVLGESLPEVTTVWDPDRIILYHLGVGAGDPATDPGELAYTYEGAGLKVLPSFATIPPFGSMLNISSMPGMDFNLAMLLHGEHEVEIHRPIPLATSAVHHSIVTGVFDKGKAAVVVVETTSSDSGGPLFTNRATLYLRGEGGFGGDPGPAAPPSPPERDPDLMIESATLPQQALLYRLSGDKNPLHADPGFAALGGFDRPILHGLCSFGVVCKAVVDSALAGAVDLVGSYRARFAGTVLPGETIVTSIWNHGEYLDVTAVVKERGTPVLNRARITINHLPMDR